MEKISHPWKKLKTESIFAQIKHKSTIPTQYLKEGKGWKRFFPEDCE